MAGPLLTDAEMRESLRDPLSPHFLTEGNLRQLVADHISGEPLEGAFPGWLAAIHRTRCQLLDEGRRGLVEARVAAGEWRWPR